MSGLVQLTLGIMRSTLVSARCQGLDQHLWVQVPETARFVALDLANTPDIMQVSPSVGLSTIWLLGVSGQVSALLPALLHLRSSLSWSATLILMLTIIVLLVPDLRLTGSRVHCPPGGSGGGCWQQNLCMVCWGTRLSLWQHCILGYLLFSFLRCTCRTS
jgi:hypothetical protein